MGNGCEFQELFIYKNCKGIFRYSWFMDGQVTSKSLIEMVRYFSDVDVCIEFVASLRWLTGTVCPHCESKNIGFLKTRRIWKCRGCRKQFSVKTGTIFEESPISLDKWRMAIWLVVNCKTVSAAMRLPAI